VKPSRIVTTETAHARMWAQKKPREREREMNVEVEHLELTESECLFPRLPDSNLL